VFKDTLKNLFRHLERGVPRRVERSLLDEMSKKKGSLDCARDDGIKAIEYRIACFGVIQSVLNTEYGICHFYLMDPGLNPG